MTRSRKARRRVTGNRRERRRVTGNRRERRRVTGNRRARKRMTKQKGEETDDREQKGEKTGDRKQYDEEIVDKIMGWMTEMQDKRSWSDRGLAGLMPEVSGLSFGTRCHFVTSTGPAVRVFIAAAVLIALHLFSHKPWTYSKRL